MAKILVENINVSNMAQALKGMRNPLESWRDSDSTVICCDLSGTDGENPKVLSVPLCEFNQTELLPVIGFVLGEADKALALRLIRAGSDHSKFMRQIGFIADITAPMTWWWDFDTYKVSTTKNSTSRMHKLGARSLTREDFGWETADDASEKLRGAIISDLNGRIEKWKELKGVSPEEAKLLWRSIIDDLPQSYMFKATWSGNYQILRNIWFSRKGHKQVEFDMFRKVIESLPYSQLITCE